MRLDLVKIIHQVKNSKFKLDNHRPFWVLEVHRVFFYLNSKDVDHKSLVLIDQEDDMRATIDGTPAVPSLVTTAVHPSVSGSTNPIGVVAMVAAGTRASGENAAPVAADGGEGGDGGAVAAAAAAAAAVLAASGAGD